MIRKVAFTTYPIRDVARARDFYENKLGLTIGLHGHQGDKWWIEYDLPEGGCIALSSFSTEKPGGGVIALEVDDLEALVTSLSSQGVVFKGDVVRGPNCRMRMCEDSEGNGLLLHQRDAQKP